MGASQGNDARFGIWLAVIASAGFSLKAILAKLAYPHGVDPVTLVALRMLLAAPVFAVVAWREAQRGQPLTGRDWATVTVLGLFGYYGASMLDFYGLQYISAGLERLVLFTYPTLTLLIGWIAHGRRITRRETVASLLCYGGIALAVVHDIEVSGDGALIALGCALVFGSSLSFALYLTGAAAPIRKLGATRFSVLDSETVDSFELGAKTALMNRTLFLDGAAFFYQYDNFQTTVQQGTQFVLTNAGKAESYGFEGQLRWVPSDVLTLFATYAYNHSRFKTGVRDGNHFRLSPDHSASFGAQASLPAGPGRIVFTPSVTWQSKAYFDDDNDRPDLQQPPAALVADNIQDEWQGSYALVNARLGYEAPGGAWRIEGFIENAFDKKYIMDAGNTGDSLGMPTFIGGAPRFYGVSASFRFGGAQ